jgi:outer membrane protein OmpA-like peptidoglycan-associated protein
MIRNTLSLLFCLVLALNADGQQLPYYVVIGAYAVESNAQRATVEAHTLNYPAVYGFNSERKFFYVYVRVSPQKELATATLNEIRKDGFRSAWIFQGALQQFALPNSVASNSDSPPVLVAQPLVEAESISQPAVDITESDIKSIEADIVKADSAIIAPETAKGVKPAGRGFVFKLISERTGNAVSGMVRLQENDRSNQFLPFMANDLVYVTPPVNRAGRWVLVCHVIGYKPLKTSFSYKDVDALAGVSVGNEQEIILPVTLERVKRGDYIEMEGVRFYANSSIMKPESEQELQELLAMMNENPNYKIRIHGHTNGSQSRDIVSLGESTDVFHTNNLNKKHAGSAKELSALRAESVKLYLSTNGIADNRISVKGEGGLQMLYDPKGTLAGMNDRVEIEVTKH